MEMTKHASEVNLDLSNKLEDKEYRREFFWSQTSAEIASSLISLRKKRGLSQNEVAVLAGTKQPAISRVERADYDKWNLKTLRTIAEALDARIRVTIEPAEDVVREYDEARPAAASSAASLPADWWLSGGIAPADSPTLCPVPAPPWTPYAAVSGRATLMDLGAKQGLSVVVVGGTTACRSGDVWARLLSQRPPNDPQPLKYEVVSADAEKTGVEKELEAAKRKIESLERQLRGRSSSPLQGLFTQEIQVGDGLIDLGRDNYRSQNNSILLGA
jgi:transcriptional regulator with XRE-family HTH domain